MSSGVDLEIKGSCQVRSLLDISKNIQLVTVKFQRVPAHYMFLRKAYAIDSWKCKEDKLQVVNDLPQSMVLFFEEQILFGLGFIFIIGPSQIRTEFYGS